MRQRTLGQKISALRRTRGLSQRDLAAAVKRSESWVSQVERDIQPVERLSVLKSLAEALEVDVVELRPDAAVATEAEAAPPRPLKHDLEGVRGILSGHPALPSLWDESSCQPASAEEVASCERAVVHAQQLLHASRYTDLSAILVDLVPRLERLVRPAKRATPALHRMRAQVYQIASAAFSRQDESDAAWIAADRAMAAAEMAGEPLEVVAAHFRMTHAFIRLQQYTQAEHIVEGTGAALSELIEGKESSPETLSLAGAIQLAAAVLYAREGNRTASHAALDAATAIAERLGADRNDFNTEFGPTNVLLHRVAVAIDLADAGEALEVASKIKPDALSAERRARLLIDVARAHSQCRQFDESLEALLAAEALASEQVLTHHHVRAILQELHSASRGKPSTKLAELCRRAGVQ